MTTVEEIFGKYLDSEETIAEAHRIFGQYPNGEQLLVLIVQKAFQKIDKLEKEVEELKKSVHSHISHQEFWGNND